METAIEWLELQFEKYTRGGVQVPNQKIFKLTEKAKQKEKEQIMDAYCEGFKEGSEGNRIMPEEYYYDLYNQFIKKITITEFNQNK